MAGFDYAGQSGTSVTERLLTAGDFSGVVGAPSLSEEQKVSCWALDQTTIERIASQFYVPTGWATVDIVAYWANQWGGAGNVVWDYAIGPIVDGATLAPALASTALAPIAMPATDVVKVTTMATGVAVTAATLHQIKIGRLASDAGDTYANDAPLIAVLVRKAS